nr:hypothetical protein [Tanacetum cinerariifolium]
MSLASSAVTYTSVYTDSEPGRVFWGADEELSDGGSSRVIVYGYDGLPMLPVAPPSPYYGADEELLEEGSPRVIVYGYDGLHMMPVASPSPDYIPGPEEPQTPPTPQDQDEHKLMFIQPHDTDFVPEPIYPEYIPLEDEHILPAEEQPLPPVVSPTADSPGYVAESDPEEDPNKYEEDETEDGPVDYPMDGGDDGDDNDDDSSGYDADDEDKDEEDEEEEHLASTDSTRLLAMPTPSPSPLTSLSPPSVGDRLARCTAPAALPSPLQPPSLYPPPVDRRDDIPESGQPPRKRICLSTLCSRYEVRESSTKGRGVDYGFADTVEAEMRHQGIGEVGYGIRDTWIDPTEAVFEMAPTTLEGDSHITAGCHGLTTSRLTYGGLDDSLGDSMDRGGGGLCCPRGLGSFGRVKPDKTLRVMRDIRREMGDMQAELLALRGQSRRARQPGGDVRVPNHHDAPRDADSHI